MNFQKNKSMETKVCKECNKEQPIGLFKKTRWGTLVNVCNECTTRKLRKTKEEKKGVVSVQLNKNILRAKKMRLAEFTPSELMEELVRRGYHGKLTYTETHEIGLSNF